MGPRRWRRQWDMPRHAVRVVMDRFNRHSQEKRVCSKFRHPARSKRHVQVRNILDQKPVRPSPIVLDNVSACDRQASRSAFVSSSCSRRRRTSVLDDASSPDKLETGPASGRTCANVSGLESTHFARSSGEICHLFLLSLCANNDLFASARIIAEREMPVSFAAAFGDKFLLDMTE